MRFVNEQPKQTPIKGEYDVIITGAGPAGVGAAISAGRLGLKTLLIENSGDLGGVATIGLMSHWTGSTQGGIYAEIIEKTCDVSENFRDDKVINPERLKTKLLEMVLESGAEMKLYTMAAEPVMEANKITGVICESKSGREAYLAKIVIDASGDGDIAARAGALYRKGREEDGKMQPLTLMFKVGGVDTENAVYLHSFESTYETAKGELQALAREHLPHPAGHVLLYQASLPGIVTCNMTNCIDIDATDGDQLTQATLVCRRQMDAIVEFLREFVPGYENCFIISAASFIGIRETRHFEGNYTLTGEDILAAKVFEDWVVTHAQFSFDVHNVTGAGLDAAGVQKHFTQKKGYTIPFGCIVSKNIDNLLFAGRNISGTHLAHSSYRVMPICANLGQAAATAAYVAVQRGVAVKQADVVEIQSILLDHGVIKP